MSGYTLAQPIAVTRNRKTRKWDKIDISTLRLIDLFTVYCNIEVAINDLFGGKHTLKLYDYEFEMRSSLLTISAWLESIGDVALRLTDGYPELNVKEVYYIPGTRYIGDIKLTPPNTHPSHERPLDACTDLTFKYQFADMVQLSECALCSVNGYYLQSHYDTGYIRVPHAGEVMQKSSLTSFGLLNFDNVGTVTTQPITKEMVLKVDSALDYGSRIHINSGIDMSTCTMGIVIGGYLHMLNDFIRVVDNKVIALTLNKLDIIERILEDKDTLDLEFMGLDDIHEGVRVDAILDDEKLLDYITCKYSFLVFISNPNLFKDYSIVDNVNIYGSATVDDTVTPARLITERGKAIDYWYTVESKIRCMQFNEFTHSNWLFKRTHWEKNTRINDARLGRNRASRIRPQLELLSARI